MEAWNLQRQLVTTYFTTAQRQSLALEGNNKMDNQLVLIRHDLSNERERERERENRKENEVKTLLGGK